MKKSFCFVYCGHSIVVTCSTWWCSVLHRTIWNISFPCRHVEFVKVRLFTSVKPLCGVFPHFCKNRGRKIFIEKSYLHFNFFENHKRRNLWMEGEWFCLSFFVRIKTMDKFIVQALTNGSSQICWAGRSYFLFRATLMPCIFIYAPQQAFCRAFCKLLFLAYSFVHDKHTADLCCWCACDTYSWHFIFSMHQFRASLLTF